MKKNQYSSVPGTIVFPLLTITCVLFSSWMIYYCYCTNQLSVPLFIVFLLWIVFAIVLFVCTIPYSMCKIIINPDHILCKMPLHKNIVLLYEHCYIGMDYHVQNGGKIWWIYFCYGKMPPYKNPHLGNRINSIKCQPGFIRIMYRDEVYDTLLETLPKKQKTALISARRVAGFDKQGRIV